MNTHRFTLTLDVDPSITESDRMFFDFSDSVFDAGCSDALLGCANGVVHLDFDRKAESLDAAISAAVAQVQSIGVAIRSVDRHES